MFRENDLELIYSSRFVKELFSRLHHFKDVHKLHEKLYCIVKLSQLLNRFQISLVLSPKRLPMRKFRLIFSVLLLFSALNHPSSMCTHVTHTPRSDPPQRSAAIVYIYIY